MASIFPESSPGESLHSQLPFFQSDSQVQPDLTSILIADPHVLFRGCLRAVLTATHKYRVVGETADIGAIPQMVIGLEPDVLLLDWNLSQHDGMRVLRELSKFESSARIILMAFQANAANVTSPIQLGVFGILSDEATPETLCDAIDKVRDGQYVLGQAGLLSLVQSATNRAPRTSFQRTRRQFGITRREFDILSEVVAGYSTMEIAERLSLSANTLKHHIGHIYDKLGVSNRLELVLFALSHHLVSEES